MDNHKNQQNEKFKKWLDILQQESWQLELIISGFAIYGLFMVVDPIRVSILKAQIDDNMYSGFFWYGLFVSWFILTVNLLAHVVLRGLWIGAIGLRYVSGEIDYDALNYNVKFLNHLKKRVGSFDDYVAKLEKYCSVIFSITFLLIFYMLGVLLIIFLMSSLESWVGEPEISNYKAWIGVPAMILLVLGSLLTFIDFISQGWLKRKKWTTFFYYPIYWVFKYLTLSFLYRPMVYNLLDTKFGKRLSFIMVPLYIGISILAGMSFRTSNYLDFGSRSTAEVANVKNYEEFIEDEMDYVNLASIPSKVITDPFLKVFIMYGSAVEDDVFYFYEELKPNEDRRGFESPIKFGSNNDWRSSKKPLKDYLNALQEMYRIKIDSTRFPTELVLTENKKNQKGYETFLDMKDMARGRHLLEVARKTHVKDSVYFRKIVQIPFWYYPE
ncbi:hypothetical protein [Maribacter sp. 2308TA10-17]|uniref:hypothetical protein n=1 Tax=Maribacter sp. 2308TA10-17 TaxID=3386276 RepID=UPI0039BCE9B4